MIARMRGFSAGRSSCSGHEGSGIEGEGRETAIVADADLRSEKAAAEQHAGSTGTAEVFDDGQVAGAVQTLHATATSRGRLNGWG